MREMIVSPPRTIMEVFKMLPEGTLAEVIENTLYMSPTPTTKHQRIVTRLLAGIHEHVSRRNLGEVFTAPFDVFLDENSNAVQPVILFIARENFQILNETESVHGVPDLVIEILSPGNKKHDQVIKKNLYEKFGVKEYWIVDPETGEAVGYWLNKNKFEEPVIEKEKVVSKLLNTTFPF